MGGVELLLVVHRTGAGAQADAAVLGDDLLHDRLLALHRLLGALEAHVGDAHLLLGVPALGAQVGEQAVLHLAHHRGLGGLRGLDQGQAEAGLRPVREASEGGVDLGAGDRVHAADAVLPVGVHVGDDLAHRGGAVHLHGALGDHAQAALAAHDHLVHAGAAVAPGHGLGADDPAGVHHPHAAHDLLDVAVLVGLHAGGAGRCPAAHRGVGEGVGEVAHGPAQGVQLLLEVGTVHAGLHPGQARGVVDLQDLAHAAQVHGEHGALLGHVRGDGAGDAGAAAVGDQHQVLLQDDPEHRGDLVLAAGVDHRIHQALEVALTHPEQVRQGASEGVDHAELVVVAQVLLADHVHQCGAGVLTQARRGDRVLGQIRGDRVGHGVQIQTDDLAGQRGEPGLVAPVEGDVLQAPAPPPVPLHVLGVQPVLGAQRCVHAGPSPSRALPRTSS